MNKRTFYIDTKEQHNGDNEIHEIGCRVMPSDKNKVRLGSFETYAQAYEKGTGNYSKINACIICLTENHKMKNQ